MATKRISLPRKKQKSKSSDPLKNFLLEADQNMLGLNLLVYVQPDKPALVGVDRLPAQATKDILKGKGVHRGKLKEALKGSAQLYEWSHADESLFFQTTMLPLPATEYTKPNVLIFTRDITSWAQETTSAQPVIKDAWKARTFSQILLAAREEERRSLSRALHDEIGSAAVILTSLSHVIRASVEKKDQKQALRDLTELDKQIQGSIQRLKDIIVTMRPIALENNGALCQAIKELAENVSRYAQISYSFTCAKGLSERGISDNVKIVLYRVVQEALTNITKHAKAKHIKISLTRKGELLHLSITDDGIGFKPVKQQSIRHVGLLWMKDGVEVLGGTLRIQSAKGKGTRIEVTCPCVVYEGEGAYVK